jgi:hypothetical protein
VTRSAVTRVPRRLGARKRPRRGARALRNTAAAALVALAALAGATASLADGDPASDYLVTQNLFLAYTPPSASAESALEQASQEVYAHGNRIKVALIYTEQDLGSVPSLFGQPTNYAKFLSIEISYWYQGPLLVVMPSGFGFYNGGSSTAAAEQLLGTIPLDGSSPDGLAQAATGALTALESAGDLSSTDVLAPLVTADPAVAKRGRPASLRFTVYDNSGRASATIRIFSGRSLLATLTSPSAYAVGTRSAAVDWLVPIKLPSRQLRFCVVATDPSGNRSKPSCAPFLRIS